MSAPEIETTWVKVCPRDELPEGGVVRVAVSPPVAVFNVDGELFATADTCTHAQSSLSEGYVDGDQVECELHWARFCIKTGAALTRPATRPLATFHVKVEDNVIYVKAPK